MDLNDVDGDAGAGVRTLPVVLGKRAALAVAAALAAASVAAAAWTLATGPGLHVLVRPSSDSYSAACLVAQCSNFVLPFCER